MRKEQKAIPIKRALPSDLILYPSQLSLSVREAREYNFPGGYTTWSSVTKEEGMDVEKATSNFLPFWGTDVWAVLKEYHRGGRARSAEGEGYMTTLSVEETPTSLDRGLWKLQKPGTMFWRHNFLPFLVPICLVSLGFWLLKNPSTLTIRECFCSVNLSTKGAPKEVAIWNSGITEWE